MFNNYFFISKKKENEKVSFVLFFTFLLIVSKSGAQSTPTSTEYWGGKWKFTVIGTLQGDTKFFTNLTRKDGKLTGELTTPADTSGTKIPITKVEETTNKIVIYFTAQGYDVNLEYTKVDDNNLKGTMMSMFEATGLRLKE